MSGGGSKDGDTGVKAAVGTGQGGCGGDEDGGLGVITESGGGA